VDILDVRSVVGEGGGGQRAYYSPVKESRRLASLNDVEFKGESDEGILMGNRAMVPLKRVNLISCSDGKVGKEIEVDGYSRVLDRRSQVVSRLSKGRGRVLM
jgi:hypothetical protein